MCCPSCCDNPVDDQIKKLADFITENVPGEPSRSEGAVDVAIRLISDSLHHVCPSPLATAEAPVVVELPDRYDRLLLPPDNSAHTSAAYREEDD